MKNSISQEIEVRGHLIDSLILTKIFDKIMDLKGEFQVEEINIGKTQKRSILCKVISFRKKPTTS